MNVLFLASWYPSKVSPQNGNFIQQHALAVSGYCKVGVLHAVSREQEDDYDVDQRWNKNVFEVIVYYKKITSRIPLISDYRKFKRQSQAHKTGYKAILKQFGSIDIVHLNVLFPAGLFALSLKKEYHLPFIISENWTKLLKSNPNKINLVESYFIKKIARAASVICPVSNDLKNAFLNLGVEGKYQIVPNVVDIEVFYPLETRRKEGKVKILHVSTLNDQHKNITGILDTMKRLSLERDDFELNLVSDSDATPHIEHAKTLNILDNVVHFHGIKTGGQIAEMMRKSDFFILFSNYENLPCVLIESLASGIPVISSNVGGVSEIINNNNGIIVEPRASEAFYNALKTMLNDLDRYDSDELRKDAVEKFSYQSVGKTFYHIYEDVNRTSSN